MNVLELFDQAFQTMDIMLKSYGLSFKINRVILKPSQCPPGYADCIKFEVVMTCEDKQICSKLREEMRKSQKVTQNAQQAT